MTLFYKGLIVVSNNLGATVKHHDILNSEVDMIEVHPNLVNFVRPSEHSEFSPSGGDKWMACPFSIKASKPIPEETSKYAAEGTLAHTVVEDYFHHKYYEMPKTNELMMANDEMMESAQTWHDVLSAWLTSGHLGKILWFGLEKGIPIYPEESCFGTADAVIVGTEGCAIIDFKYGKGRAVGARSTQLMLYLLGVYRHLSNVPENYLFHAVISQPRIDPVPKHAEYTKEEMDEFAPKVWDAIQTSKRDDLKPVEGSHCFWCKARRTNDPALKCPAIKEKALKVANENFDLFLTDMSHAPEAAVNPKRDAALRKVMALLPLMQEIAKSAEEEFQFRIERGEKIEGIILADKTGRREWALEGDALAAQIKKVHPDVDPCVVVPATTKMKTISQVEKEVGKKNFDQSLTKKKVTKKIILDDRNIQSILGELEGYNRIINGGN